MAQPADLSFVGIAKEATPGVYVPPTAYLGVKKVDIGHPIDYQKVEGLRGSMGEDYGVVPTFKWGTVDIEGPVYADTLGWITAGILGDLTNTGASAPYTSAQSLKNSSDGQPTTHSITDFYVANTRGVAGLKWHELEIKWTADGLIDFVAKGTGLSVGPQAKPTSSITAILPTPAWIGALTIGGAAMSKSSDGSIKFTRKMEVLKLMNGTQTPTEILVTTLGVEFKYKAIMDDDTELTRYLTNTQPSLDLNFSQGAGAGATQLLIHCSTAAYVTPPKLTQDLGKPVVLEVGGRGILNSTDAGASGGLSPVKVTIQSAVAGTVYQ